jgi:IclR family acetate operon transcriptional repressor
MVERKLRRGRPAETAANGGQVQSLSRALAILATLAESGDGMTLTDVAQIVGLPPSTVHRLLTTLQQQRFVRFEPLGHLWQVGVQAFVVGSAFVRTRDVVGAARPFMRRLMEESGETVNLYVEHEGEAICMSQVECRQLMRAIARPGGRVKMHCSGAGKALLAYLPDGEVTRILQRHGLPRITERTLDTPKRLRADLAAIRARGYAIDDEEHAIGLRCVAAPVFDEHGAPAAGLSLSGPSARVTPERLPALGALAASIAGELSHATGGIASTETKTA